MLRPPFSEAEGLGSVMLPRVSELVASCSEGHGYLEHALLFLSPTVHYRIARDSGVTVASQKPTCTKTFR